MEQTKPFFLSVNQRIFSNWTALRLAVENDMGPLEQAIEFCSYTTDLIYMNEDITVSELAEELEGYMDDQFNTEVHDDSCTAVATDLLKFFHYCIKGDESSAKVDLEKLPEQSWLSKSPPQRTHPVPVKHDSSSEEDMEVDVNEKDDGWTMVKNRRNR